VCQQPVFPVQAVGVDWWVLEVHRGRAVGVGPEDVMAYPPVSRLAVIGEPIS
jgi:hypothetical protein